MSRDEVAQTESGIALPPEPPREEPPHPAEDADNKARSASAAAASTSLNPRLAPQDIEAERSVLGGILLNNDGLFDVLEILKAEDFYREPHRQIFKAMHELAARNEPIDMITLGDELRKAGQLNEIGANYVSSLDAFVPDAGNLQRYAQIVKDAARDRQLIVASHEIARKGYEQIGTTRERMETAERLIFEATEGKLTSKGLQLVKTNLLRVYNDIEARSDRNQEVTGLHSGFPALDKMTAGFHEGHLIILGGRPGMGKSTLLMDFLRAVAMPTDPDVEPLPALLFSLEMGEEEILQRLLSNRSNVAHQRIRTGKVDHADWQLLAKACDGIHQAPLYIDETAGQTVLDLRTKCRRLKMKIGRIGIIGVDYLQLMRGHGRDGNREQEVADISSGLRELAKEMKCPVIALSQLNRTLERRAPDDRRPQLADLRESGALEQDADLILFAYRDWVYNKSADREAAEIIVGKQRAGPSGVVKCLFKYPFFRFEPAPPEPGDIEEMF